MDHRDPGNQGDRLRTLPVGVSVRVCGRLVTIDQFLRWAPGTILPFDQLNSSPLTLCVGDRRVGEGQAVKIGSTVGLRLLRFTGGSPIDRAPVRKSSEK